MPNLMLGAGLAIKHLGKAEEAKTHNEELRQCVEKLNGCVDDGRVDKLFGVDATVQG